MTLPSDSCKSISGAEGTTCNDRRSLSFPAGVWGDCKPRSGSREALEALKILSYGALKRLPNFAV